MRDDPIFGTEEAPNQSPPFSNRNLFLEDCALREGAAAAGVDADAEKLADFGAFNGSGEAMELGRLANEFPPRLRLVDARGNRLDQVEFHPAYHALMARNMAAGLHCSIWDRARPPGIAPSGQAARAARLFMATQAESGHICPLTMTSASVAALRHEPAIAEQWTPKILGRLYDPALRPWWEKSAVTLGMGMTEPQGGTDVRANVTRAAPIARSYEITGSKWFMSAPMCDAFLVLAQAPGGLTTFLTPRFRPDGSKNGIFFQRLKDKLGNRSNASSEVVFSSAFAERVGPEGQGVRTIIEMVQMTRLDCVVASAGLMRFALAQATHHARHRRVFQKRLVDQPLMRAVLADLALEVEGATALAFRLARAFDRAAEDPEEAAYARLITPAAKFLVCKAAPHFVYEAMECLGGNGYVEEWPLARAYREAPVNAIWEGSGNVMALDVLRAAARAPETASAVIARLNGQCGLPPEALDLEADLRGGERLARRACERLARLAAAAALAERQGALVEAYVGSRLTGEAQEQFGAGDLAGAEETLIERVLPAEAG
jgi:putative acyl-CoA dehydrogenase